MISRNWARALIVSVTSFLYWQMFAWRANVVEPWDATAYWTFAYPLSVMLAGVVGWHVRNQAWAIGMITSFAQLPVMAMHNEGATNWAIALLFLIPLSIPHSAVAFLTERYRRHRQR